MRKIKDISVVYIVISVLIAIIVVGFIGWKLYQNNLLQQQLEREAQLNVELEEQISLEDVPTPEEGIDPYNHGLDAVVSSTTEPEGVLVFTSRNMENANSPVQVLFLDVAKAQIYTPSFISKNNTTLFAEFLDNENPKDFFVNSISKMVLDAGHFIDETPIGVHLIDPITPVVKYIASTYDDIVLTKAYNLEWSPTAQKLAFSRQYEREDTFIDMLPVDNWKIEVVDPVNDTPLFEIDKAIYSEWSPDGTKLLYFKTDGLYVRDIPSETDTKLKGMSNGGKVIGTSMMDVSPDGKYLIWTSTYANLLVMYEIVNWDTVELKEIGRINVPGTQFLFPQFSPDSQFYAVQAIDLTDDKSIRVNPRFEIRPTLSREVVNLVSVESFNFTELHTDGWIAYDPTDPARMEESDSENEEVTEEIGE